MRKLGRTLFENWISASADMVPKTPGLLAMTILCGFAGPIPVFAGGRMRDLETFFDSRSQTGLQSPV